jgi:hypothetical protein
MSRFEIRLPDSGSALRVDAPDVFLALEQAVDAGHLADGDEGSIEPAEELPVGLYGDDPEEAD